MAASGVTRAASNRSIRHEALREQLAAQKLEQKVIDDIAKIADLSQEMGRDELARLEAANALRMKLLNKVFPDLKAVEVSGEGGGPIGIASVDPSKLSTNTLRELIAQREAAGEQSGDPG